MRSEPASKQNLAPAIAPAIQPNMPWRLVKIEILPNFRISVEFVDGLTGVVDMSGLVKSNSAGVFAVLADPVIFNLVTLINGAATWPGELDLAPDAMYRAINTNGIWILK